MRSARVSGIARLGAAVLLSALALALPGAARGATILVDVDGTVDAAGGTCTGTDAAPTLIATAVAAATNGDTIRVCPGTYNEAQIILNKALTVQSVAGAASTIIDGTGGTGLALAGTVVLNATTGNVTLDGFTVRNAKAGPSSVRFNVRVGSSAAVTMTVINNVLLGTNNPADGSDYGLYAAGPNANDTLVFQHNTLRNHGSNTILIERHKGPTDVSFNDFTRGVRSAGISAYINMSHTNDAITNLQKVSNNVIDMANDPGPYTSANASSAIVFQGALTGSTLGTFSNVEISGNVITGLRAFRRGIALVNNANSLANQNLGKISGVTVSCNSIGWSGAAETTSRGIWISGYVAGTTITGNAISGVDIGLLADARNGHIADTASFTQNSVTGTGVAAVSWSPTGALVAENDWWGSATGPTNAGNPGGTGGVITATGPVDFTPWLLSGGDADPGTCFVPGCGNGTTDSGEDCDAGALNGDASSCCTTACTFRTAGDGCRAAAGLCDVAETCTGASGACPADAAATAGTVCRAAAGTCDVAETCDGVGTACPADSVSGAFVVCRPSAGACDPAESCDGVNVGCPADALSSAGTTCRAAAGVCDLAETCDGATPACPADLKSTATCRTSAGPCDVAESCDGATNGCPADAFAAAGTTCRGAAGACDVAETCSGASAACPADGFAAAGTTCRAAAGVCDLAEQCTGGGPACPADAKSTAVCRPASGQCDVAESCNGVGNACPADGVLPDGSACDTGDVCGIADSCQAGVCTSGGGADADGDNVCDASDNCPGDANPGQADLDGDLAGDVCDADDAPLNPTLARVKIVTGPHDTSSIKIKGDFVTLAPGDVFSASAGIAVGFHDGAPVPTARVRTFAAGECLATPTRIKCRSTDRLASAVFKTSPSSAGVWKFSFKSKRDAIVGPLVGPATASVTYGAAIDRVGAVVDCQTTFVGLNCKARR